MRPLYESIKEDKSEADKFFETLGYEKEEDDEVGIWYVSKNKKQEYGFFFDKWAKEIIAKNTDIYSREEKPLSIEMQELQAINQKCKELGWL